MAKTTRVKAISFFNNYLYIFGIIFLIVYICVLGFFFFRNWKTSTIQLEKEQRTELLSQYEIAYSQFTLAKSAVMDFDTNFGWEYRIEDFQTVNSKCERIAKEILDSSKYIYFFDKNYADFKQEDNERLNVHVNYDKVVNNLHDYYSYLSAKSQTEKCFQSINLKSDNKKAQAEIQNCLINKDNIKTILSKYDISTIPYTNQYWTSYFEYWTSVVQLTQASAQADINQLGNTLNSKYGEISDLITKSNKEMYFVNIGQYLQ